MNKWLLKALSYGVIIGLLLVILPTVNPVLASTSVSGNEVSGTWTVAGSPYLIEGDITVPAGEMLTIEPGVEVVFQSWYKLTVHGTLLAEGTASAPILFTGTHPTAGWLGIRFINAPDGSRLTHVIVEKGRATGASPEDGGGGIYIENSNPVISNSTIRDNFAKNSGGGIYLTNSNAVLIDNSIVNNSAGQGPSAFGGGLYMSDSNPELTGNLISGNWVYVSGSYSTPSGFGGGIYSKSSSPTLKYNIINGNRVDAHLNSYARGGAIYFAYGSPDLINNTITGNAVTNDSSGAYSYKEGGGIYVLQSSLTVVNTILWNDAPEEIYIKVSGPAMPTTIAYSDVQGGRAGIVNNDNAPLNWLDGNIKADPKFVDPANGDFQLRPNSRAIDAGTAYFEWQSRVLVDLSPDEYVGPAPDMGALESDSARGRSK